MKHEINNYSQLNQSYFFLKKQEINGEIFSRRFSGPANSPWVSEDGRAYTVLCKTNEYHLSFFTWTKQTSGLGESAKSKFVWTNWTCSLKLMSPKNIRTIIVFATGFKFYSTTTRTGALGRRFSNHNHF